MVQKFEDHMLRLKKVLKKERRKNASLGDAQARLRMLTYADVS